MEGEGDLSKKGMRHNQLPVRTERGSDRKIQRKGKTYRKKKVCCEGKTKGKEGARASGDGGKKSDPTTEEMGAQERS